VIDGKSDVDGVYLYLALVLGIAEAFLLLFHLRCGVWGLLIVVVTLYTFSLRDSQVPRRIKCRGVVAMYR
jgi:hypothetical protein